jgi:hypothetical protein
LFFFCFVVVVYLFIAALGIKLKPLHILGKCSTASYILSPKSLLYLFSFLEKWEITFWCFLCILLFSALTYITNGIYIVKKERTLSCSISPVDKSHRRLILLYFRSAYDSGSIKAKILDLGPVGLFWKFYINYLAQLPS